MRILVVDQPNHPVNPTSDFKISVHFCGWIFQRFNTSNLQFLIIDEKSSLIVSSFWMKTRPMYCFRFKKKSHKVKSEEWGGCSLTLIYFLQKIVLLAVCGNKFSWWSMILLAFISWRLFGWYLKVGQLGISIFSLFSFCLYISTALT